MSILGFIIILIVAALIGSVGAAIVGYSSRGCLTSSIIGLVGALIGKWLSQQLNVRDFFYIDNVPIVWSIVGAALFVFVIGGLIKRR